VKIRGTGPLPHPNTRERILMRGRVGERAGAASIRLSRIVKGA
jgi:hypothetical protein